MDSRIFGRYFAKGTADNWERGWISKHVQLSSGDYKGCSIEVKFSSHRMKGNSGPYISVTATAYERGRDVAGGCMHDEIATAFPELSELISFHLSTPAEPMHYVANAVYWAEFVAGISQWEFDKYGQFARAGRTALDVFRDHIAATNDDDTAPLFRRIEVEPPAGVIWEQYAQSPEGLKAAREILATRVREFCEARAQRLQNRIADTARRFRLTLSDTAPTASECAGACPID